MIGGLHIEEPGLSQSRISTIRASENDKLTVPRDRRTSQLFEKLSPINKSYPQVLYKSLDRGDESAWGLQKDPQNVRPVNLSTFKSQYTKTLGRVPSLPQVRSPKESSSSRVISQFGSSQFIEKSKLREVFGRGVVRRCKKSKNPHLITREPTLTVTAAKLLEQKKKLSKAKRVEKKVVGMFEHLLPKINKGKELHELEIETHQLKFAAMKNKTRMSIDVSEEGSACKSKRSKSSTATPKAAILNSNNFLKFSNFLYKISGNEDKSKRFVETVEGREYIVRMKINKDDRNDSVINKKKTTQKKIVNPFVEFSSPEKFFLHVREICIAISRSLYYLYKSLGSNYKKVSQFISGLIEEIISEKDIMKGILLGEQNLAVEIELLNPQYIFDCLFIGTATLRAKKKDSDTPNSSSTSKYFIKPRVVNKKGFTDHILSLSSPSSPVQNFSNVLQVIEQKKIKRNEGASLHKNRLQSKFYESMDKAQGKGLHFEFTDNLSPGDVRWADFDRQLFNELSLLNDSILFFLKNHKERQLRRTKKAVQGNIISIGNIRQRLENKPPISSSNLVFFTEGNKRHISIGDFDRYAAHKIDILKKVEYIGVDLNDIHLISKYESEINTEIREVIQNIADVCRGDLP